DADEGKPMKVLYWVQSFLPSIGGIQVMAGRLLPALQERGFRFVVVASHDFSEMPDLVDWEGIPVHRFPFREALTQGDPGLLLETRARMKALKEAFQPELVHMNLTDASVFFHLQTQTQPHPPFLLTPGMAVTHESAGPDTVLGRALRSADRITTISRAMLDNLVNLVPEVIERSEVVYNGLDVPGLAPSPLPMDPPRLLCLGRASEEKGFDLAFHAFAALAEDFPGVEMTVAGGGPALESLQRLAVELGIGHRVEFTGWVEPEQIPAVVNRSTLVLVPSRCVEGFGLVALEAHQMGRPVVASRVGGLPEVVREGETGSLVGAEDADGIAEAVGALLRDPTRLTAMGKEARRWALEAFSWQAHVDAYDRIYREMMARS
ncbi:MAG: glycosyltransferase family 4 protein, partial [Gemmatimonadota bacterium]